MSILEKLAGKKNTFSLEFFPPKSDMPISSVYEAVEKLCAYDPAFVSVTYGAGGGNKDRVIDIASYLKEKGFEAIAHLTCVGADPDSINYVLEKLEESGIKNVLAVRGDIPQGMDAGSAFDHYRHATDLIREIRKRNCFTIGAAAYPEAHMESDSLEEEIKFMRLKEETGANFFITQLCFDKYALINFYEKVKKKGISVPVITGIMPVLNPNQITKMALLSACSIPAALSRIISRYGNNPCDFRKAGLEYAIEEIEYLMSNNINKFHIYTMNKPDVAEQIILGSHLKDAV